MRDSGDSFGDDEREQTVEGQLIPAHPTPKRIRLGTLKEIRREMANVYSEVRRLKLPSQEGTRLVYMLVQISNQIRDTELEERIEALEKKYEQEPKSKNCQA